MLTADRRRFSTVPEEETTETTLELINAFLENLNASQDADLIKQINRTIEEIHKKHQMLVDKQRRERAEKSKILDEKIAEANKKAQELEYLQSPKVIAERENQRLAREQKLKETIKQNEEIEAENAELELKIRDLEAKSKEKQISKELLSLSIYQSLGVEFFEYEDGKYKKGIASIDC